MTIAKFVVTDSTGAIKYTGSGIAAAIAASRGMPGLDGSSYENDTFFIPSGVASSEATFTTTGTINDLDFGTANLIRMNNATAATITGLKAGNSGQLVTIVSIGAGQVNLSHQTTSTAANRLVNFCTSADTPLAAGVGTATYQYDITTARWRLITHEQGLLIAYTCTWRNLVTNPVLNNGTLLTSYFLRNREVEVVINLSIGNTTTLGTGGLWLFSLPINFGSTTSPVGPVYMTGAGGTVNYAGMNTVSSAFHAAGDILGFLATGGGGIGDTNPAGIAANDFYRTSLVYGVN